MSAPALRHGEKFGSAPGDFHKEADDKEMNREILCVDAVEKEFDRVKAVDGLSFDVCAGEIFALLGPNGAGKTTTVRMLTGITRPDRGEIRYALTGEKAMAPAP